MALGKSRGVGSTFTKTWYAAPWRIRPRLSRPSWRRALTFHLESSSSLGGSETIRTPPTFKKRAAHSATTEGGPNDRAVTKSNEPSSRGSLANSSARPVITSPSLGAPGHSSTSRRKFIRFTMESRKTPRQSQCSSSTRPGRPPPLPRSKKEPGGVGETSSQHAANPSA